MIGRNRPRILVALSVLFLGLFAGCEEGSDPLAVDPMETELMAAEGQAFGLKPLTVMSRNLYHGGDIGPVLAVGFSDLELLASVAADVWAEIQANDFKERAVALVDEIEETRPDVIGLQELAEFVTLELDLATGTFGPTGVIDFQAILEEEIADRKLGYSFVAVQDNTAVRVPVAGTDFGAGFVPTHLVQLKVRDAVLVRRGLDVSSVTQANYQAVVPLGLDPFGNPLELKRGWIRVEAKVNGVPHHFVNTHMEIQPFATIQVLQTQELLTQVVTDLDGVTILMGDFNSDAAASPGAPSWTPSYQEIISAGFSDAWLLANPGAGATEGLTCCQASDLRNSIPELYQRIDFIFLRTSGLKEGQGFPPGTVDVEIVGEEPGDWTTPSGIWPSDHAGVVADLELNRGRFK